MAAVAARWSITLGRPVTPAQVVLCLIDLKLARLGHDPAHADSILDVAGYAAVLQEVRSMNAMKWHPRGYGGRASRTRPGQAGRLARTGRAGRRDRRRAADLARARSSSASSATSSTASARRRPWLSGPATWSRSGSPRRPTSCASCRRSGSAATSAPGRTSCALGEGVAGQRRPDAPAAAEHRRDHPDGGGDHLEPLPRARRGPPDVGARRGRAVEAALLPVRHQPADGAPAVGLRAQRHRLAAERAAGAPSARPQVCGCECAMKRVVRGCNAIDGHAP